MSALGVSARRAAGGAGFESALRSLLLSSAHAKYRPDVDGLRAVAVLSVLLFHSGLALLPGGYVGVDIFFVISGFVIASGLAEEIAHNRFSIANFYARRIRRILPALVFVILGSYVAALVLFLPDALCDFARSILATATFLSNMYFWKYSGYFETAALDRPLLHTWSLAIEEQFYVFIPIVLFLLLTRMRRQSFAVFAFGAVASLGMSIFVADKAPTANFFVLPTRAWELLLGVLVALAPWAPPANRHVRECFAVASVGLVAFAMFMYNSSTPFPGYAALAPTLGTAVLIYLGKAGRPTLVANGLSLRPIVGIGLLSYSLYLVHWPVLVFARYALLRDLTSREIVPALAATFVLAWFSWRYIETPFRRPYKPVTRRSLFMRTAAVVAALCALGIAGVATNGFGIFHPGFVATVRAAENEPDDWLSGRCFLEDQAASDWAGDICLRTRGAPRSAILWGDSFAAQYVSGVVAARKYLTRNIVQYTFAGCVPVLSYRSYARPGCHAFNARIFDIAARYRADTVILSARWDEMRGRGFDGLAETIDRLRTKGLHVYVIGQSPMFAFDVKVLDYRGAGRKALGISRWYLSFGSHQDPALRAASAHARFIDPLPTFCRTELCTYKTPAGLLFSDYGHFSRLGSALAVQSYFPLYQGPNRGMTTRASVALASRGNLANSNGIHLRSVVEGGPRER